MIKVSHPNPGVAPASVTQKGTGTRPDGAPPSAAPKEGRTFADAYAEAAGGRSAPSATVARDGGMPAAVAMSSSALKQELSRLQQQLQDAQRRLSMELARPKLDDSAARAQVKLLRSRVSGLQSAIQTSTASLAQMVEQEGGSPPGKLLNVSA